MELLAERWLKIVKEAETILSGNNELSIDVLIRVIKQINPTPHINFRPEEKEKAYHLKSELQSLLLTNYGELFNLEPVQWDENIVLLRYKLSPFVDACHAKLHLLSRTALAQVRKADTITVKKQKRKITPKMPKFVDISTLNGIVEQARVHMDNFEYDSARDLLMGIKINCKEELPVFLKGLDILIDEIGAFDVALKLLFSIPKDLVDNNLREPTANVCWLNNRFADARGLFEECVIKELKKESIFRYADILHREGDARAALDLLNYADTMSGHIEEMNTLEQKIHQKLKEEATPYLETGRKAFDANNFDIAEDAAKTALAIFPEYNEASELLKIIQAINYEDTLDSLWKTYHEAESPKDRLSVLKKLQNKDFNKREEIFVLIEKEALEEKKKQDEKAISEIAAKLETGLYEKAFDKLYPLLQEGRCYELIAELSKKYPQIQCIVDNRQLLRLKHDEAKDCWLSYFKLNSISLEQETEKVLVLLKKAGKAFRDFSEYAAMMEKCNAFLAEQSRQRLQEYFAQLESEKTSLENADKLAALIRKEATNLPNEESEMYELKCQEILNKLKQEFNVSLSRKRFQEYCRQIEAGDMSLEMAEKLMAMIKKEATYVPKKEAEKYTLRCQEILERLQQANNIVTFRKSLLLGDTESAIQLKQQIHDMAAISQIENEIASLFAVEVKPLNVVFNTDIYSAFKNKYEEGLRFLNCINNEAFFNLSVADDNYLVILHFEKSIACQYKMINFNYKINKIIHADPEKDEYHLLCEDNDDAYYYVKAQLYDHNSRVMAHLNLSDMLLLDKRSSIEEVIFLADDPAFLYVLYIPDEDEWDYRMMGIINLHKGNVHKKKEFEFGIWGYAKIPTSPVQFLIGDEKLFLYDGSLQKVRRVLPDFKWERFDQISVDALKRLIYIFATVKGKQSKYSFVALDFDLNIIECHEDICPNHDFSFWEKHYDTTRDVLFISSNALYDYKRKKVIKNFGAEDFSEDDFIVPPLSIRNLCQAIKDDGYNISLETLDNSTTDFLNEILNATDFYDHIRIKKPDLQLSEEVLKQAEETKDIRIKKFDNMEFYEQRQLKKLNRELLLEIYPDLTPKPIDLSSSCFFVRQETDEYFICAFSRNTGKLVVTNITPLIDRIVELYETSSSQ